jgi:hypothetical protein
VVVPRLHLGGAVGAGAEPRQVLAEPVLQPALVVRRPARRTLDQAHRVDDLDEPAGVDDAASALVRIPAHQLRKPEVGIHARRRIEEPGAKLRRRAGCVHLVAAQVIREAERLHHLAELRDPRLVEIGLALGIRLAIAADVRKPVRLGRIGPPVRAEAQVVVLVAAWREHHGARSDREQRLGQGAPCITEQTLVCGRDAGIFRLDELPGEGERFSAENEDLRRRLDRKDPSAWRHGDGYAADDRVRWRRRLA